MQTASYAPGQTVRVPCRVTRAPAFPMPGRAQIDAGWSRYTVDFAADALRDGFLSGVIDGPAPGGKWTVTLHNGMAPRVLDLPLH